MKHPLSLCYIVTVPQGGARGRRHPTSEEWKVALRVRLEDLGWSDGELARRLGVSPEAISYLFAKAVTSTLRPRIEELVGWPRPENMPRPPSQLAVGSRRPAPATTSAPAPPPPPPPQTPSQEPTAAINSGQLAELISYYQALNTENKARLVERAHSLFDGEDPKKGH